MRVVDAHRRRVLDGERGEAVWLAWSGVGELLLAGVFAALALGAAGPVAGPVTWVLWALVGAMAVELAGSVIGVVDGVRELRRLRGSGAYLAAVVEVMLAEERVGLLRLGVEEPPAGAR